MRVMKTTDDTDTTPGHAEALPGPVQIRIQPATMSRIEDIKQLLATRAVEGLPQCIGATLSIQVPVSEIINMAITDWLARATEKPKPPPKPFDDDVEQYLQDTETETGTVREQVIRDIVTGQVRRILAGAQLTALAPTPSTPAKKVGKR